MPSVPIFALADASLYECYIRFSKSRHALTTPPLPPYRTIPFYSLLAGNIAYSLCDYDLGFPRWIAGS